MPPLFVYYSLEGNCRRLSRRMADAVGGDAVELIPVRDDMPRGAVLKYVRGGKDALTKKIIELTPLPINFRERRLIFVGGPVWAWNMTPAVRSFLSENDWNGISLALFAMCRNSAGGTLKAMAALARERGGEVVGMRVFTDLRRGDAGRTEKRAVDWAVETKKVWEAASPGAVK
ncbi:MAG: hypothetical protein FWG74_01580 [Planctomycetes bacterium]|nr:hypothetical protein [Planctomycetota bacterium]